MLQHSQKGLIDICLSAHYGLSDLSINAPKYFLNIYIFHVYSYVLVSTFHLN